MKTIKPKRCHFFKISIVRHEVSTKCTCRRLHCHAHFTNSTALAISKRILIYLINVGCIVDVAGVMQLWGRGTNTIYQVQLKPNRFYFEHQYRTVQTGISFFMIREQISYFDFFANRPPAAEQLSRRHTGIVQDTSYLVVYSLWPQGQIERYPLIVGVWDQIMSLRRVRRALERPSLLPPVAEVTRPRCRTPYADHPASRLLSQRWLT